jgi:hypothetical protein
MNLATKLRTASGLSWRTIRRYAKSEQLERNNDDRPVYMHVKGCKAPCRYTCNGEHGDRGHLIAEDVDTLEGNIDDDS